MCGVSTNVSKYVEAHGKCLCGEQRLDQALLQAAKSGVAAVVGRRTCAVPATVTAGMLRPMANVSVVNSALIRPSCSECRLVQRSNMQSCTKLPE
jgi:hypothetical protein